MPNRVIAAIGLNGSGKDVLINRISLKYGIPMITMGDLVREVAIARGVQPSRENLTHIATTHIENFGRSYWPGEVIKRITEQNWPVAGVSGLRTPTDVNEFRRAFGDQFILVSVMTHDPRARFERLLARAEPRDPKTFDQFLAQDASEEKTFNLSEAVSMANHVISNDGDLEDYHSAIDEFVSRIATVGDLRPPSPARYWFLVGSTYCSPSYNLVADWDDPYKASHYQNDVPSPARLVFDSPYITSSLDHLIPLETGSPPSEVDLLSFITGKWVSYFDRYLVATDLEHAAVADKAHRFLFETLPRRIPRSRYFLLLAPDGDISLAGVAKVMSASSKLGILIIGNMSEDTSMLPTEADTNRTRARLRALSNLAGPERLLVFDTSASKFRHDESLSLPRSYSVTDGANPIEVAMNSIGDFKAKGIDGLYVSVDVKSIGQPKSEYARDGHQKLPIEQLGTALDVLRTEFDIVAGDISGIRPLYAPNKRELDRQLVNDTGLVVQALTK